MSDNTMTVYAVQLANGLPAKAASKSQPHTVDGVLYVGRSIFAAGEWISCRPTLDNCGEVTVTMAYGGTPVATA